MTRHDPLVSLRHMLDHAEEAVEMARGRVRADLDADRQFNLAIVRLLEIIGEAAARIPALERQRWASVPWLDIIGLRNRIIHGYDTVNFDIVWAIVQTDLPPLIEKLRALLSA